MRGRTVFKALPTRIVEGVTTLPFPTVPDKNERAGYAAVQIVTQIAISVDIQPVQECHT